MKQLPRLDRECAGTTLESGTKTCPGTLPEKPWGWSGLGKIGSELARMCHLSFDMHILAFDPYLPPEVQNQFMSWVEFCDLERLFETSDIVSLHLPLLLPLRK